jgi:hypothetical protein
MGVATAVAAVGAGIAIYGAVKSGQANDKAAAAQGEIAKAQYAMAEKAAGFAAPTTDELKTLNNQIKLFDTAHATSTAQLKVLQEEITNTYGANIIEMGEQLHAQLTGADSEITRQTNDQIERQRKQYQAQLQEKLGPGALTSSAGIQAMAAFNREANTTLAQVKEQSLNGMIQRIGGMQGGQSQALSGALNINNSLSGMLNQIQGVQNVFQTRQMNAWNQVAGYAGAEHVGALQQARGEAGMYNSVSQIGGNLAGAGIGAMASGGGSAAPKQGPDMSQAQAIQSSQFNASDLNADVGQSKQPFGSEMKYSPYSNQKSNMQWG